MSIAAMVLTQRRRAAAALARRSAIVPPEWPPTPPAASVEAPTASPATSAVSETTEPWSDGMSATAPNRFVEEKGIRFMHISAFGRKPGVPLLLPGTRSAERWTPWDPRLTGCFRAGPSAHLVRHGGRGTYGRRPRACSRPHGSVESGIEFGSSRGATRWSRWSSPR